MAKKNKEHKLKQKIYLGIGAGVIVIVGVIVAIMMSKVQPKKIELTSGQPIAVLSLVSAVAKDKLNGGGTITKNSCEEFRNLAKSFDKDTDWFSTSYCNYIIYADYSNTENTTVITLSDGAHSAIYTFDYEKNYLLDYKFTESSQKGRGITIRESD